MAQAVRDGAMMGGYLMEKFLLDLADQWCATTGQHTDWPGRPCIFGRWSWRHPSPPVLVRHDLVGASPVGGPPLTVTPPFPSMLVFGNDGGVAVGEPRSYVAAVERWQVGERTAFARRLGDDEAASDLAEAEARSVDLGEWWDVEVSVFLSGGPQGDPPRGVGYVDRRWSMVIDEMGRPLEWQHHGGWGCWSDSELVSVDDVNDSRVRYPMTVVQGVMHALALMNCKNIVVESDALPIPRPERRRRLRSGKPSLEFKTLKVEQGTTRRSDNRRSDGGGMPVHVCRGHFKTYTPERPLFGKMTGTYWWQDHARGSAEVGVVDKDYEV